jgi:hypothetical protein
MLSREGRGCYHVVKGRLGAARPLIRPLAGVRIVDVPRSWFVPAVLGLALYLAGIGRLSALLVDNEKSQRRWILLARLLRRPLALIALGPDGRYVLSRGGIPVSGEAISALAVRSTNPVEETGESNAFRNGAR